MTSVFLTRPAAEGKLRQLFGHGHFYDEQWRSIQLLWQGKRVLLIEKTGFGKSLCFQFPATQFPGLTVVFSPLIALMRDQVRALAARGIPAGFVNCEQSPEENRQTIQEALKGKLKILYIAPERQENQEWMEATRRMKLSMVVVDEAHCISVWGHDFRPAFRRIVSLVNLLPADMPVLATTATATKRVEEDIARQIGGELSLIRGNLMRENFRLYVVKTSSEDEKMCWLAENLGDMPGHGIIYTGTRANTEIYSRWLASRGIQAVNYSAALDGETRIEVEKGLMGNRWKCIVSTNALGMGIDKPDIRFIIHTQRPVSPVHYYQEIGRAGRDGKPTLIILFYNAKENKEGIPEDNTLPLAFIDGGRPKEKKYHKAVECLKQEPLGERQLMMKLNMKQTPVRVIIADLMEQGIIREARYGKNKKYEYIYNAPPLNTTFFGDLREKKRKDLEAMTGYVHTSQPRMKYLCEFLGDQVQQRYSNCDNSGLAKIMTDPSTQTIRVLKDFTDNYFPVIKAPRNKSNLADGVASSFYGPFGARDQLFIQGAARHNAGNEYGDVKGRCLFFLTGSSRRRFLLSRSHQT